MRSPLRLVLFAGALLLCAAPAAAQAPPSPPDGTPPERTITIDEAEPIDASTRGPLEEHIEGTTGMTADGLIPIRESFLDRLIESADAI